jgi:tRNA A37 N6-isopentenylltransferase MiaA
MWSMVQLVVVAGPTGVGKTERATELARKFDAPIVVLDRVQCHAELAVGSGRYHVDESRQRIFLDERRVADGMISASAAYRRLCQQLDGLRAGGDRTVVLEGGSTSLLAAMARDARWRHDADVSVERLAPDTDHYRDRLVRRVANMLVGDRSMVDEVRALWPDHRTHPVLRDIVGYREVVAAMIAVGTLDFGHRAMKILVQNVTDAHLAYSHEQRRHMSSVLPLLR